MKCTDFENRIELLFDDNTPAEVRREMLEHLETCPACAEFYRQTKAAFNTVAPRVEVQAPAGLKARILKTAAQAENTPATARTTAPAYEGENETYIEASAENSGSILYDKEIRDKPRTRRTKRNV